MRELAATLAEWLKDERRFALATVVQSSGSSPRAVGSAMLVRDDGLIAGSVSGGCVEGAVVEAAQRVIETGRGELLEFGPASDAVLFEVGLSCGGQIRVWVEPGTPVSDWLAAVQALALREELVRVTAMVPENPRWALGSGQNWIGDAGLSESSEPTFCTSIPVPPRLVIIGGVHIAVELVRLAKAVGFETVVIDPRGAFAREDRFDPAPDRLMSTWPLTAFEELKLDKDSFVVTLSHDAKIDNPAVAAALRSPAGYVGALGSRKTQESRRTFLRAEGLSEADLDRLHGPVGLDIGATNPEEIALSILAQVVQLRRKGPVA